VLSSVVLARVGTVPALVLIPLGAAAMGAAFLGMAFAGTVAVAAGAFAVGGAGNGVYYVSVVQALQERIPDDLQARVMSLLESTTAGAYGVGFLLGGALGLGGMGVLLAAGAIVTLLRGDGRSRASVGAPLRAQAEPAA
jgi:hypothetical protein